MNSSHYVTSRQHRWFGRSAMAMIVVAALVAIAVSAAPSSRRAGAAVVVPHVLGPTTVARMAVSGTTIFGKGAIDLESWSWGASAALSSTTGLPTGKVKFNEFTITKNIDKASPTFFHAMQVNTVLPTVTLTATDSSSPTSPSIFTLTFSSARVVSVSWTGSNGSGDSPQESVSLNFTKVIFNYQGS